MKSVSRSEEQKKAVEEKAAALQTQLEGLQTTLHQREGDVTDSQFHLTDTKRVLGFVEANLAKAKELIMCAKCGKSNHVPSMCWAASKPGDGNREDRERSGKFARFERDGKRR